jgi:hypothetical protein
MRDKGKEKKQGDRRPKVEGEREGRSRGAQMEAKR